MRVPTVHLNGTSGLELSNQIEQAYIAINNAIAALQLAAPHARDYYTQGDNAFREAETEYLSRCKRLQAVRDELGEIWDRIYMQLER